jgi:hypothetical protein
VLLIMPHAKPHETGIRLDLDSWSRIKLLIYTKLTESNLPSKSELWGLVSTIFESSQTIHHTPSHNPLRYTTISNYIIHYPSPPHHKKQTSSPVLSYKSQSKATLSKWSTHALPPPPHTPQPNSTSPTAPTSGCTKCTFAAHPRNTSDSPN